MKTAPVQKNTSAAVLSLSKISKSFAGKTVLDDVSLDIQQGEIFGLVGPDGAGKTTLIEIVAGLTRQDRGEIIRGRGIGTIGFVPQDLALYQDLTVEESLDYQASLIDGALKDPDRYRQWKERTLSDMGLWRFRDRLTSRLSGGMRQKLALCLALIGSPGLLVLDEPTTGLDPAARLEMWRILQDLAAGGVSILISTPILSESENCHRVALIYRGSIRISGTCQDLKNSLSGFARAIVKAGAPGSPEDLEELELAISNKASIHRLGDHLEILAGKEDLAALREQLPDYAIWKDSQLTMENVFFHEVLEQSGENPGKTMAQSPPSRDRRRSGTAIEATGIEKRFGDFTAVSELDLTIEYGSILGLLGANGAGKTTCMKMLCGLTSASGGKIEINGKGDTRQASTRKSIGYMSQKFSLYEKLTVLENLRFYATVYEVPRGQRQSRIDRIVERFGLEEVGSELVGNLPLGWKQRVSFGAAVLHEPDILFLDEPTAGVDPLARRKMWQMIRELRGQGRAILVTTHYMDEAIHCDTLALMHRSRLVAAGSPLELKERFASGDDDLYLDEVFIRVIEASEGERP
ncbi:MAG: ATP-binding cassette domain-containing protein [Candidatus Obscuribacterales bacterium]